MDFREGVSDTLPETSHDSWPWQPPDSAFRVDDYLDDQLLSLLLQPNSASSVIRGIQESASRSL